jgi:hypothetical protein
MAVDVDAQQVTTDTAQVNCGNYVAASFGRVNRFAILRVEREMNDSRAMTTRSWREGILLELLYIGRWDYLARRNLGWIAPVAPEAEASPTTSEADKAAMENRLAEEAATPRRS